MRTITVLGLVLLLSAAPATAQTAGRLGAILERANAGDVLRVVDATGRAHEGRLVAVTDEALTIGLAGGGKRVFAARSVREVSAAGSDSLRNGATIGFGVVAVPWCVTTISADRLGVGTCVIVGLVLGGLGAGLGAVVDGAVQRREVLYRADGVAEASPRDDPVPRETSQGSADGFATLGLRLNLNDAVFVVTAQGQTAGTLVRLSADAIILQSSDGRTHTFAAADVRTVGHRGDEVQNGLGIGLLTGAAAGCLAGGFFAGDFRPGDCAGGAAFFALAGGGLGVLFDLRHDGSTVVYIAPPTSARRDGTPRGGLTAGVAWRW